MMRCPNCNRAVRRTTLPDGGVVFHCPACGWGRERLVEAMHGETDERPERPAASDWLRLGLYWLVSTVAVVGPFVALKLGVPHLLDGHAALTSAAERFDALLNLHYWWIYAVYLAIAAVLTPSYDRDNLGLFGSPLIDNPFSREDDYNRMMRSLALLLPGKFVWATIGATWRVVRAATRA